MTILVDMDDTIEYLTTAWVNYLNRIYGTSVTRDDLTEWDVTKAFPGYTREQVYAPLLDDNLWKDVRPIENAAENLQKLISDGHKVYIVTATHYQTLRAKMDEVLFKYFPFISWSNVIITSNKQLVRGDIMIDDGPHNLVGGDYIKILMEAPHNKSFDEKPHGIYRVKNWNEAYELVCRLTKKKNA